MLDSYSVFSVIVIVVLVLITVGIDLGLHRQNRLPACVDAGLGILIWLLPALVFAGYTGATHGGGDASLFLAGYALELSLSVNMLLMFAALFARFNIPDKLHRQILYIALPAALVFRVFIVALGAVLLSAFNVWAMLLLGLLILWTIWKKGQHITRGNTHSTAFHHWSLRVTRRLMPVHGHLEGQRFLIKTEDRLLPTPLLVCLSAVLITEINFSVDTVPAVFAVTQEPFLVCAAGIFAILGARPLYFLLAAARRKLWYLDKATLAVLVLAGMKILFDMANIVEIPPLASLGIVLGPLAVGLIASLLRSGHTSGKETDNRG